MKQTTRVGAAFLLCFALVGCGGEEGVGPLTPAPDLHDRLARYAAAPLRADLSTLTPDQRRMLPLLIEAAGVMDDLFWVQAFGSRDTLLSSVGDPDARRLIEINYGPWDRLALDEPFLTGINPKPPGARFYPLDMTKEEFENAVASDAAKARAFAAPYSLILRDETSALRAVPYHRAFREALAVAADRLRRAAALAENPGLRRYLEQRAEALVTDDYAASDLTWVEMKDNVVDVVIGALETYEDRLWGYKAAYGAYVLIRDPDWSRRLERYQAMLPDLQKGLPVPDAYKRRLPRGGAELSVHDALLFAGSANAGPKTVAIDLPSRRTAPGTRTRRLQLRNVMRAKFDRILVPIADVLVHPGQRSHVTFDAFFVNAVLHEVAHGLGVDRTLDGGGTVTEALGQQATTAEELKADALGMLVVSKLHERGELGGADLLDHQVTFLASVFRSVRFVGAASAHGRANLARFNFFRERGAFKRDPGTGTWSVDPGLVGEATDALAEAILRYQGDGDQDGVAEFMERYARAEPELQADLDRLAAAGIAVDLVFEQGPEVLGLPAGG